MDNQGLIVLLSMTTQGIMQEVSQLQRSLDVLYSKRSSVEYKILHPTLEDDIDALKKEKYTLDYHYELANELIRAVLNQQWIPLKNVLVENIRIGDLIWYDGQKLKVVNKYPVNGEGRGFVLIDENGEKSKLSRACGTFLHVI